jgi:hypothetical protein
LDIFHSHPYHFSSRYQQPPSPHAVFFLPLPTLPVHGAFTSLLGRWPSPLEQASPALIHGTFLLHSSQRGESASIHGVPPHGRLPLPQPVSIGAELLCQGAAAPSPSGRPMQEWIKKHRPPSPMAPPPSRPPLPYPRRQQQRPCSSPSFPSSSSQQADFPSLPAGLLAGVQHGRNLEPPVLGAPPCELSVLLGRGLLCSCAG